MVQEAAARTTRASRCVNGASFTCCLTTADRERFHRAFSVRRRYVFLSLARKLPLSRSSHAALLSHRGSLFERVSERRWTFESRLVVSRRSRWRRGCSSWRHDDARAWEALLIGAGSLSWGFQSMVNCCCSSTLAKRNSLSFLSLQVKSALHHTSVRRKNGYNKRSREDAGTERGLSVSVYKALPEVTTRHSKRRGGTRLGR